MSSDFRLHPGVSVVVCCHNSAGVLPKTLECLCSQSTSEDLDWEIIVVDNASVDDTSAVATEFWREIGCSIPLSIVAEPKPGLSAARRRGILTAHFSVTIFCDDDNWLCSTYVETAFQLLSQNDDIALCGGRGVAVTQGGFPPWFTEFERAYAVGPQNEQEGVTHRRLYGAGLVVRTHVLRRAYELGFESQLSDRKGDELSSGGDSEIAEWFAILSGGSWYYSPELQFKHFISADRLCESYLLQLQRGFGRCYPVLSIYKQVREKRLGIQSRLWGYQVGRITVAASLQLFRSLQRGQFLHGWHRQWAKISWMLRHRRLFGRLVQRIESMHRAALCDVCCKSDDTHDALNDTSRCSRNRQR